MQGPDFEGQIRRLRTGDGVHFTKAGAVKLASYVDHELRRVMSNHVVPVALPGPEEKPPAKPGVAGGPTSARSCRWRPAAATAGDLLGAGGNPAPATPDPVAAKVLSRGDPIAAPAGRADDFSWPRAGPMAMTPASTPLADTPMPAALERRRPAGEEGHRRQEAGRCQARSRTADSGAANRLRAPAGGF